MEHVWMASSLIGVPSALVGLTIVARRPTDSARSRVGWTLVLSSALLTSGVSSGWIGLVFALGLWLGWK
jgi:hypothetical protein